MTDLILCLHLFQTQVPGPWLFVVENPAVEKIKSVVTTKVGSEAVVVVVIDAEVVVKTTGVVTAPLNKSFKGSVGSILSDPIFKKVQFTKKCVTNKYLVGAPVVDSMPENIIKILFLFYKNRHGRFW